jgi:hypothetical protein
MSGHILSKFYGRTKTMISTERTTWLVYIKQHIGASCRREIQNLIWCIDQTCGLASRTSIVTGKLTQRGTVATALDVASVRDVVRYFAEARALLVLNNGSRGSTSRSLPKLVKSLSRSHLLHWGSCTDLLEISAETRDSALMKKACWRRCGLSLLELTE